MTTPDMPGADLRQQQVDQIIDEFNITLHQNGWRVWEGLERLATEVARLREALAAMEDHRDGWRTQADEYHRLWTMEVLEARKLRDILTALRKPSEAVVKAAIDHYLALMLCDPVDMDDVRISLRAAVAAAEQEVASER